MALSSALRRVFPSSSILQPQFTLIRNKTTVTTENTEKAQLCVRSLSRLTTIKKLRDAFSPFGQVLQVKVIANLRTGKSKGFGFVTYATQEEAEKARQEINGKLLDGWPICVDQARALSTKRKEYW